MLEGLTPPTKVWPCRVASILEELDGVDREIFANAILDLELWAASTLSKELRKRGIVVSDNAIHRHRRGECSC